MGTGLEKREEHQVTGINSCLLSSLGSTSERVTYRFLCGDQHIMYVYYCCRSERENKMAQKINHDKENTYFVCYGQAFSKNGDFSWCPRILPLRPVRQGICLDPVCQVVKVPSPDIFEQQ